MTKNKAAKPVSKAPNFPNEVFVAIDYVDDDDICFACQAKETDLVMPGEKETVAIYRLVDVVEMSAEVVVSRKPSKK